MIIFEEKQLLEFIRSTNSFIAPFGAVPVTIFSSGVFQSVFIGDRHLLMLKKDFNLFIKSLEPNGSSSEGD